MIPSSDHPAAHQAPPDQPHVRLSGVNVSRSDRVLLRDLHLDLPRGTFLAVTGPSGVGKSSLLETLAGNLSPRQGQVTYCCQNRCLHSPANFRHRLGVVFQHFHLSLNSSVLTNVLCGSLGQYHWTQTLLGFPASEQQRAVALIHQLGLLRHTHRLVAQVSGGERQRTAIARALMQEPELILADEPVSNLDRSLARSVLTFLRDQTRRHARTVVCVLHDLDLVDQFADQTLDLAPSGSWTLSPA